MNDPTMKTSITATLFGLSLGFGGAAPFQNLDFDDANTNQMISVSEFASMGYATNLLPGWEQNYGVALNLNTFPIGFGDIITLVTSNGNYDPWQPLNEMGYPATGPYHLHFEVNGRTSGPTLFSPLSIWQVGDIPADANSLWFFTYGSPFEVRINGSLVPVFYNYLPGAFGANLRAANAAVNLIPYHGTTVELRFTTLPDPPRFYHSYGLDGIHFSPEIVPEPSSWALLVLGGGWLAWTLRRRKH